MKRISLQTIIACSFILLTNTVMAEAAKSEKHAKKATEVRQSVFTLLGANMGTLGGMAKGKIPLNEEVVNRNAVRIHQLSLMLSDYTKTDTRNFKVKSESLPEVWADREAFEKSINELTLASNNLIKVSTSGDKAAIKSAIGSVGKTCGGCHDNFKKD